MSEALEALADGGSRLLSYGVSDDNAFAAGLACGGTIRVLVEPVGAGIGEDVLAELAARRQSRLPVALVVNTADWSRRLAVPPEFADRFRADRSGFEADGTTFVGLHNPPLRLIIVGASHIAQTLAPMARMAGFDVTLVDPRGAFAAAQRFTGEDIREAYPDEAMPGLGLDARTAVVTLSHDPKIDDPGLEAALRSRAFYIGALGSSRTHAKRAGRLSARGFDAADIGRIHAPVGLDIKAQTPAEIAVSVLAQVIARVRGA